MNDFRAADDRMKRGSAEKKQLAIDNGYKYYSEMIYKKRKSGINVYPLTDWISKELGFKVSVGSVTNTLGMLGAGIKKQRKKKKNKFTKPELDMTYTKDLCSKCKTNYVAPGQRMLCRSCFNNADTYVGRHGHINMGR